MRKADKHSYQFTKSPKVLLKAKLDNIAIVPASMLPFKETLQELINNLPEGGVFLCHAKKNTRQRKLLERVEEILRQHGHAVMNLSMEQVVSH
jgi:predicted enzyme involved in methoxymalonyl-ACP biosynthesis